MRIVTRTAPLRPDWRMLIHKRAGFFCVTLHASDVSSDAASQSLLFEVPVWIVTIAAAHQAFVHLVVERLRKSWLHISVAGIAELWLRNLEQAGFTSKLMNAVTTHAAYVCTSVCRSFKIGMCPGMAFQTLVIDSFRSRIAEPKECLQAATSSLHMLSARSMAALAGNTFAAVRHRKSRVRILRKLLAYLAVTGFAGL